MLKSCFITAFVVVVVAGKRKSPNAEFIEELFENVPHTRFSDGIAEDATLDVPHLIAKYGYPVEIHTLITPDGYILEAHRIPHGRGQGTSNKPPVLVMHGLMSSSADFVLMGPGKALAYKLVDAGYDVWLLNARGNYYSRRHYSMSPGDMNFWRFSWDEIGNYDLPTYIDHVIQTTGHPKVHYIGHSQGGTSFLVLTSLRPEYNDKILSFQGLAPASFFNHNENSVFKTLAQFEKNLETVGFGVGIFQIPGYKELSSLLTVITGDHSIVYRFINEYFGTEYNNVTKVPVIIGHTPAGASVRQIAHYGQLLRHGTFRRYNHLLLKQNFLAYGSVIPPEYDLSRVVAPVYLHCGFDDAEVDYRDLLKLASVLPNVIDVHRISRDSFNHFDFLFAIDAPQLMIDPVIEAMKDAEVKFGLHSYNYLARK